jgi:hypothetical protein
MKTDLPERTLDRALRRRVRDAHVRRLVQPAASPRRDHHRPWLHDTSKLRSRLLPSKRPHRTGEDPNPRVSMKPGAIQFVVLSRSFWVGWTGLGWATPFGGQAHMRSHRPKRGVGGSRQVIMRTASEGASAGYWVRLPPRSSCRSWEVFERLSCDVSFQTAHDLSHVLPLATATSHIGSGSFVT